METPAIKTNFIPKDKGKSVKRSKTAQNIFLYISIIILLIAVGAWGGLYFYLDVLEKQKINIEEELKNTTSENVDINLVNELGTLDKRLDAVNDLLGTHIVISPIFAFLNDVTLTDSIRYFSFNYHVNESYLVEINLSGYADSFTSLGYQKQVFQEHEAVVESDFMDFSIDEDSGKIRFSLLFILDPKFVLYRNVITDDEMASLFNNGDEDDEDEDNGGDTGN